MTDSVVVDLLRGRGRPPLSEEQKAARAAATAEQKAAAKREKLQTQAEQAGLKLVPLDQHGDSAFLAYPPDQEFDVHELCRMFPPLEGEEFDALIEDIRRHGQREAGTMFECKILDGLHRYRACQVLRIPFLARVYDGDDPLAFVISANIRRRHLTREQKCELIERLLSVDPARSDRSIARNVGVNNKTVAAVRSDLEGREEIPHVEIRMDSKGRQQPARKPRELVSETVAAATVQAHEEEPFTKPTARKASCTARRVTKIVDFIDMLDKPERATLWDTLADRWADEMRAALDGRLPVTAGAWRKKQQTPTTKKLDQIAEQLTSSEQK